MAQDLRELFAKEREQDKKVMKAGHEARFLSKLEEKIPLGKGEVESKSKTRVKSFFWLRIAASAVVLLGLAAYFIYGKTGTEEPKVEIADIQNTSEQRTGISLGDLSPDLKKVESYYVTNINLQLSDLEFTGNNKAIIDSYMLRLSELDKEYRRLTVELNDIGPNDDTINALIQNLQLRLQLLQKLKSKLNQLKSSKNEQEPANIV
ncbi:hypothetical protein [Flagellimonas sp. S3867]|uniref:hypothetical protein n=1 Tax=Flagellimonas sp. S3867 TaxID=2768063 RepID=UPI0016842F88|nr:hypothetical protein [Flagellimonas sp. S3867]